MKSLISIALSSLGLLAPVMTLPHQDEGAPTVPAAPRAHPWVGASHTEHFPDGTQAEFLLQLSAPFHELETGRVARVGAMTALFTYGSVVLQRQLSSQFLLCDDGSPLVMTQQAVDPAVALFFAQELVSPGSGQTPDGPEPEGQWFIAAAATGGTWGSVVSAEDIAWEITFQE